MVFLKETWVGIDEIFKYLSSILVGFLAAYFGSLLALKKFKKEKLWGEKRSIYKRLLKLLRSWGVGQSIYEHLIAVKQLSMRVFAMMSHCELSPSEVKSVGYFYQNRFKIYSKRRMLNWGKFSIRYMKKVCRTCTRSEKELTGYSTSP